MLLYMLKDLYLLPHDNSNRNIIRDKYKGILMPKYYVLNIHTKIW